jgi:hypothetical protein
LEDSGVHDVLVTMLGDLMPSSFSAFFFTAGKLYIAFAVSLFASKMLKRHDAEKVLMRNLFTKITEIYSPTDHENL